MSNPGYEMLSREYIRSWLKRLVKPRHRKCHGPTLSSISKYLGIPRNTLIWLSEKASANMSVERQRLFSKTIAQIENGQLDFVMAPSCATDESRKRRPGVKSGVGKIAVFRENPLPRPGAYRVQFVNGGPKLKPIERPRPFTPLPAFRDLLLK